MDVRAWLMELGLERYAEAFEENGVDAALLSELNNEDLKDIGVALPGHGGLLDRFDSLVLVGPAVFHYVNYFRGVGDPFTHVITKG